MKATPQPKTIKLHAAQRDFLQSPAIFRAFVGGIGSGKSWAGAYDLIKRGKPGRLYLVAAPTYSMLADATFRSFISLAEDLGVLEPADVKHSAPPSVRLKTGAEILFRSADDPDRLRGPNLSGVWLDEASLMPLDVFTVSIGRLREGGEQGWLSATFTPKGRNHWTHDTFASDRPDTALFHAATRDNPFLPENFHKTVAKQYTSVLSAQELEGRFIDAGGAMFKREWFPIVDRVPELVAIIRAWDLASTPKDESRARDPDYTGGPKMGRARDGSYIILDVRRKRGSPQEVQSLIRATAEGDGHGTIIWMEQEPGSAGVTVIDHYRRHVLAGYSFYAERSTGSKADRAQPLAAMAEGGGVKLLRGSWNKDFLDEAELFPFGRHDDQIDPAALAFNKLSGHVSYDSGAVPEVFTTGSAQYGFYGGESVLPFTG